MRQKNKTAQGERHKKSASACNCCHATRNPIFSPPYIYPNSPQTASGNFFRLQQSDVICASTQHVILAPRIPSAPSHMLKTNHCAAHMTRQMLPEIGWRACPREGLEAVPAHENGLHARSHIWSSLRQGQLWYACRDSPGTALLQEHQGRRNPAARATDAAGSLGLERIATARQQK
jgi:hypothetical protein